MGVEPHEGQCPPDAGETFMQMQRTSGINYNSVSQSTHTSRSTCYLNGGHFLEDPKVDHVLESKSRAVRIQEAESHQVADGFAKF